MSHDKIEFGNFVSTDKKNCRTPGILPTIYGRESYDHHYQGGTIYNYAASSLIWVENKVYIGSNETVMFKSHFDQWLWDQDAAEVSHYHGDNGIFDAADY